jgi:alkylhydroperoxidase family enzyme
MAARIAARAAPYPPELQATFDRVMPKGVAPLVLFTTLARDPRLWAKFRDGSLLDRGHLTLRQREIAIARTAALCRSEYEWGVHATGFAAKAGLGEAELASTVHGNAEDACWSDPDRPLIRACDALHASCDLDDATWTALRSVLAEEAVLEFLLVAGFYRTVSYLTNALRLPLESYAQRFPRTRAND